jgi:putative PIN family toxin of toxin-antitoxin system
VIGVVLDIEVVIRGLGEPEGPGSQLMKSALAGRFVPITTPRLLDELARTLRRRELRGAFPRSRRIVSLIEDMSMVIEPRGAVRVMHEEPANHLLAAARASAASYLATWGVELLALGRFEDTRIVQPT